MTSVEFTLGGIPQLDRSLQQSIPNTLIAVGGALYREGQAIIADSVPLVPVDEGTLVNSHVVLLPQISGETIEVVLGYGGAAQAYSVVQHEREDYHHTVGQAHYLSEPFAAHAAGMAERLAAEIATTPLFFGLP